MPVQQVRDIGNGYLQVVNNFGASQTEADSAHTVPAANLVSGIGATVPTAGRTFTLDTSANIDAAQPNARVGDTFTYMLVNNSGGAFAITWSAGTGQTFKPTTPPTVPQNKIGTLLFVKTGVATYDVYITTSA